MSSDNTAGPRTLADKLNHLIATVYPSGSSKPYSNNKLAELLVAQGTDVSATYLWQLRNGKADNPARNLLAALAAAFEVSPEYFFDTPKADRIYEQLELLQALTDPASRALAIRGRGLPAASLVPIMEVIRYVRQTAGLGDVEDPATAAEAGSAEGD